MYFLSNLIIHWFSYFLLFSIILFSSSQLTAQDAHILWQATDQDETIQCAVSYEPNRILANIMVGEYSTNYEELFTNYKNKLLKLNYKLQVLQSAEINKLGSNEIIIYGVLDKINDEIVLWGRSLSLTNQDNQLVIIHIDTQLNVLDYDFYGDESIQEYFISGLKDNDGNYAFVGSTSLGGLDGNLVFLKINPIGEQLLYEINSDIQSYNSKLIQANTNHYFLFNSFLLHELNTDFSILQSYPFQDTLSTIPSGDIEVFNDNHFVCAGSFMAPPIPGSPMIMDMGYITFNELYEPLVEEHIGTIDTTEFGFSVTVSGLDTLYFDAEKNHSNNPLDDSWISIYKIHDEDTPEIWNIGGEGQYDAGTLEALNHGGFILGTEMWDFVNYPGDQKQRDVLLFTENYGDTLVGTIPNRINDEISIFPQPATDIININQSYPKLLLTIFDANGIIVLKKQIIHNTSIEIKNLPSGMYYYQFQKDNTTIKTGKLLKR